MRHVSITSKFPYNGLVNIHIWFFDWTNICLYRMHRANLFAEKSKHNTVLIIKVSGIEYIINGYN